MKRAKFELIQLYKDYYLAEFLKTLRSERSRIEYENEILSLCEYCDNIFQKITYEKANAYIQQFKNRAYKGEISGVRVRNLYSYFQSYGIYLEQRIDDYQNPFHLISCADLTKADDILSVTIPNDNEIKAILKGTYQKKDKRAFMLLLLSYRCALTTVELINLKTEHITLKDGWYMLALTKDKFITLPEDVATFFKEYIETIPEGYLFLNKRGRKLNHMTASTLIKGAIGSIVEDLSLRDYTLMGFRKAGLLNMLDGSDDVEVSRYAGVSMNQLRNYKNAYEMRGETAADKSPIKVTL
ncbi:MAG: hypothetical protein IJN92_10120 [Lachnospiraceae bacterium]|nr:hypothetical protein [Lachnospiraceae bacterium]